MEFFSVEYALLAMQRALLREVTPELRAVVVDLDKNKQTLRTRFYYDVEASEKMIDLWDCASCETSAALGPDCFLDTKIARLDFPEKIPEAGYYAYLRKEPNSSHLLCRVKIAEMSIGHALLSVQNTLLGVVTSELRAAIVDFDNEKTLLYIRFYYDGEIGRDLLELWKNAIAKAAADFGSGCFLDGVVQRADYPKEFAFRGRYAYFRKE